MRVLLVGLLTTVQNYGSPRLRLCCPKKAIVLLKEMIGSEFLAGVNTRIIDVLIILKGYYIYKSNMMYHYGSEDGNWYYKMASVNCGGLTFVFLFFCMNYFM